ncbi:TadE/TadG family type IV pilus assembly protein [Rhizobium sp. TRM95796]|uniref:TadE/TadG family type IV pilus assembly protein n=1 Tax=Rhizobium sp. TRM95796 TaxID=2979862 RepID=UPI0021E81BE0|nr:TadE/TadG family type IV pilus assembly protein [Rhizobium sp. TRM95796]MCV3765456.1 pilus assembly protein [Rhizobium sp. TRM95796]
MRNLPTLDVLRAFFHDIKGNVALVAALAMPVVVGGVGAAIDYGMASDQRQLMQSSLDAGVLAAVRETTDASRRSIIEKYMSANFLGATLAPDGKPRELETIDYTTQLSLKTNSDNSLTATFTRSYNTSFMGLFGFKTLTLRVKSTAAMSQSGPCITVLGSSGQDVLINSGANVTSSDCKMHVRSTANPAFIMNSGSTINLAEFCVKGVNYIKNGGTLANLKTGCAAQTDPYASAFTEPTVPSTCTTSGYFNSNTVTMEPGVHCDTGFNGSPTITFKPGLHIIKGRMIINSGATVNATGVTFYFPDVNSEIRANGGLTFTASAPTSGTYKGVLMFEKTSNASNNANKTQYIFNGSNGENLEGIIYLPNRNVTYNSTTNVTEKISMVVNQMIINSANWKISAYGGSSGSEGARLTE